MRWWRGYLSGSRCKWFASWSSWWHCHPFISCFIKIQIGLTYLVPAYQVVLEKRPLNGCLSVCLSVCSDAISWMSGRTYTKMLREKFHKFAEKLWWHRRWLWEGDEGDAYPNTLPEGYIHWEIPTVYTGMKTFRFNNASKRLAVRLCWPPFCTKNVPRWY